MRLLLDTHVLLWAADRPERLGALADGLRAADERILSAVVTWELAIKSALGKLELPTDPLGFVSIQSRDLALRALPVEHRHAAGVAALPQHHRDPFDRLLIAQARSEGCVVATLDPAFEAYDVELLRP